MNKPYDRTAVAIQQGRDWAQTEIAAGRSVTQESAWYAARVYVENGPFQSIYFDAAIAFADDFAECSL